MHKFISSIKRSTVFVFLSLALTHHSISFGQEKEVSTNDQQWFQYYNQTKLNDKWTWLTDGGFRWQNRFQEASQYLIRTGVGYQVHPKIRVSTGFAHLGFHVSGEVNKIEFRPYQEILIKNSFAKNTLSHRFRIEERFFKPVGTGAAENSNSFNFRFRYALMFNIPLFSISKEKPKQLFSLHLGNEIFINAGKDIVHNVFDRNRVILGPSFAINDDLTFSLVWNSQFSSTSTPESYNNTNVIWLQVKHTIRL